MTQEQLIEYILNRLGQTSQVVFGADEIADWPLAATEIIKSSGLLERGQPAQALECRGCEENCYMPVTILPSENSLPSRAFITCDKRNDIGRVTVEMNSLTQWKITDEKLAKVLAKLLGFNQLKQNKSGRSWLIGTLEYKKNNIPIELVSENGICIMVSGHKLSLQEVLQLQENQLFFNKNLLSEKARKPIQPPDTQKRSTSMRSLKKLETQKTYEIWQEEYKKLKQKNPSKSNVWISQQIAKMSIANDRDAETIRRHMSN